MLGKSLDAPILQLNDYFEVLLCPGALSPGLFTISWFIATKGWGVSLDFRSTLEIEKTEEEAEKLLLLLFNFTPCIVLLVPPNSDNRRTNISRKRYDFLYSLHSLRVSQSVASRVALARLLRTKKRNHHHHRLRLLLIVLLVKYETPSNSTSVLICRSSIVADLQHLATLNFTISPTLVTHLLSRWLHCIVPLEVPIPVYQWMQRESPQIPNRQEAKQHETC